MKKSFIQLQNMEIYSSVDWKVKAQGFLKSIATIFKRSRAHILLMLRNKRSFLLPFLVNSHFVERSKCSRHTRSSILHEDCILTCTYPAGMYVRYYVLKKVTRVSRNMKSIIVP